MERLFFTETSKGIIHPVLPNAHPSKWCQSIWKSQLHAYNFLPMEWFIKLGITILSTKKKNFFQPTKNSLIAACSLIFSVLKKGEAIQINHSLLSHVTGDVLFCNFWEWPAKQCHTNVFKTLPSSQINCLWCPWFAEYSIGQILRIQTP